MMRQDTLNSIYYDNQNVHDPHIQRSVTKSVQNLLQDKKPPISIEKILESNLSQKTKERITEYYQETAVHSIQLITFAELLDYVWQRIENSPHQKELVKVLDEQIQDAECMCFTGRFNRTLSVLQGFYDDIEITISASAQITAVVLRLKNIYSDKELEMKIKEELTTLGYQQSEFKPWLDALDES
jgi:hypothetical protein